MSELSARDIALKALRDSRENVTAALRGFLAEHPLSVADRGLARQLAMGVVRHKSTLNAMIRAFVSRGKHQPKIPPTVRIILQLGLYQLIFLDRVPEFAAVNETVNQANAFRRGRFTGLVNGVLRNVTRALGPAEAGAGKPMVDAIPLGGGRIRRVEKPIFADPSESPSLWLAQACSLPEELATRWLSHANGKMGTVIRWAMQANDEPPVIARVNFLKTTVAEAIESISAQGVGATRHANGSSIVLSDVGDITALEAFKQGWIMPQDPTASEVCLAADIQPGMNVLDLCAAPGTKTMHLAERMENLGRIVAMDISADKLQRIEENMARMGVTIVEPMLAERLGSLTPASFDVILADVPCTNTGVLARRPEARWRFTSKALGRMVRDQQALLTMAAGFVRPGGKVIYSTCSVEPEENQEMTKFAERQHLGLVVDKQKLTRPGGAGEPTQWHDGGYYAIFRRA